MRQPHVRRKPGVGRFVVEPVRDVRQVRPLRLTRSMTSSACADVEMRGMRLVPECIDDEHSSPASSGQDSSGMALQSVA